MCVAARSPTMFIAWMITRGFNVDQAIKMIGKEYNDPHFEWKDKYVKTRHAFEHIQSKNFQCPCDGLTLTASLLVQGIVDRGTEKVGKGMADEAGQVDAGPRQGDGRGLGSAFPRRGLHRHARAQEEESSPGR